MGRFRLLFFFRSVHFKYFHTSLTCSLFYLFYCQDGALDEELCKQLSAHFSHAMTQANFFIDNSLFAKPLVSAVDLLLEASVALRKTLKLELPAQTRVFVVVCVDECVWNDVI